MKHPSQRASRRFTERSRFDRVMTGASAGCTAFLVGVLVAGVLLVASRL